MLTVLATPAYTTWLTNYPSLSGNSTLSTADPDADSFNNLMEYACAMTPTLPDRMPMSVEKIGNSIEFIYTKNKSATDVTYSVKWSSTLIGAWSTSGVTSSVWVDGATTQQIKALVPKGAAGRRLVRLRVTR